MAAAYRALARTAAGEVGQARGVVRVAASEIISGAAPPATLAWGGAAHPGFEIELALQARRSPFR